MKLRLALRMLMLTIAMPVVVVSILWRAQVAFAEQTVTVYKEPT